MDKATALILRAAAQFKNSQVIIYAPDLPENRPKLIAQFKEAEIKGVWRKRTNWRTAGI